MPQGPVRTQGEGFQGTAGACVLGHQQLADGNAARRLSQGRPAIPPAWAVGRLPVVPEGAIGGDGKGFQGALAGIFHHFHRGDQGFGAGGAEGFPVAPVVLLAAALPDMPEGPVGACGEGFQGAAVPGVADHFQLADEDAGWAAQAGPAAPAAGAGG